MHSASRVLEGGRVGRRDGPDLDQATPHLAAWTAPQLFGVHPEQGTLRIEMCGALMVTPRSATGVVADRVLFGNLSGYRNRPGQAFGPPIWDFAAERRP